MNDVYILSAARTPIGKFGGGLSTTPATELGAVAIRAAVERSGIAAGAGRRGDHGPGDPSRRRAGPGAPGRPEGGSSGRGERDHDQQGVRIRAESGDDRRRRHPGRGRGSDRRGWDGEHEPWSVPAAPGSYRLPARRRHDRGLDGARRPLVRDLQRAYGRSRGAGRREARRHPRGAGRVRAPVPPARACRAGVGGFRR